MMSLINCMIVLVSRSVVSLCACVSVVSVFVWSFSALSMCLCGAQKFGVHVWFVIGQAADIVVLGQPASEPLRLPKIVPESLCIIMLNSGSHR